MALNKVFIGGRLTADPEIRFTKSQTPVANMTVACEDDYAPEGEERNVVFVPVIAWGKKAEFAEKYMKKGRAYTVVGRLQIRHWTDQEGAKRRSTEIVAENIYFADSKRDGEKQDEVESDFTTEFSELSDDGDLPF